MNPQQPMNQPGVIGQDQAQSVNNNDQNSFAASAPNAGSPQPVVPGAPSQPESVAMSASPQPLDNSPTPPTEQPPAPSIAEQQAQLNQELNKHPLFQDQPAVVSAEPTPAISPVDQPQSEQVATAMPLYNQPAPSAEPTTAMQPAPQSPPVGSTEQTQATSPVKSIVIGIGIAVVIIAIIIAAILFI